jgi:hypothetical protein
MEKKRYKDKMESMFSSGKSRDAWHGLSTIAGYK